MKLKELQHNFLTYIFSNKASNNFFQELASEHVLDSLTIYKNNVYGAIRGALENNFPTLYKYLGKTKFIEITTNCINEYPPISGNLDDYATIFVKFLRKNSSNILLKDLSIIDYFYWKIYIKADDSYFNIEKFQSIPAKNLANVRFKLHPSCIIFRLYSKLSLDCWYKLYNNKSLNIKNNNKSSIEAIGYREKDNINFIIINKAEKLFLTAIKNKKNLEEIFQILANYNLENSFEKLINKFIIKKIINKFTLN